jgi:hypothetical protein
MIDFFPKGTEDQEYVFDYGEEVDDDDSDDFDEEEGEEEYEEEEG